MRELKFLNPGGASDALLVRSSQSNVACQEKVIYEPATQKQTKGSGRQGALLHDQANGAE
jgi:hypothetical protein